MKHLGTFDTKKTADYVRTLSHEHAEYWAEQIEQYGDRTTGRIYWFVVFDVIGGDFMSGLESKVTISLTLAH